MKKNQPHYRGLKTLFNLAGKNPRQLNIDHCLVEAKRHSERQLFGIALSVTGTAIIAYFGLSTLFMGVTVIKALTLSLGAFMIAAAVCQFRRETGYNILAVARIWKDILGKIKRHKLELGYVEEARDIPLVFAARISNLVIQVKKWCCAQNGKAFHVQLCPSIFCILLPMYQKTLN